MEFDRAVEAAGIEWKQYAGFLLASDVVASTKDAHSLSRAIAEYVDIYKGETEKFAMPIARSVALSTVQRAPLNEDETLVIQVHAKEPFKVGTACVPYEYSDSGDFARVWSGTSLYLLPRWQNLGVLGKQSLPFPEYMAAARKSSTKNTIVNLLESNAPK